MVYGRLKILHRNVNISAPLLFAIDTLRVTWINATTGVNNLTDLLLLRCLLQQENLTLQY